MFAVAKMKKLAARLHKQEEGMEALQTVLIIAFAAIVLAFAYKIFGGGSNNNTDTDGGSSGTVVEWVCKMVANVFGWK